MSIHRVHRWKTVTAWLRTFRRCTVCGLEKY